MRYKLIDNDLYVAKKIKLVGYEKEIFEMLDNKEQVSLAYMSKYFGTSKIFVQEIIKKLEEKISFNWDIKTATIDGYLYYRLRLKKKEKKYGFR